MKLTGIRETRRLKKKGKKGYFCMEVSCFQQDTKGLLL